jgi:hypothetical protein
MGKVVLWILKKTIAASRSLLADRQRAGATLANLPEINNYSICSGSRCRSAASARRLEPGSRLMSGAGLGRNRATVELRSLHYFVRIAELGSITRASAHLHVAQPALAGMSNGSRTSSPSLCSRALPIPISALQRPVECLLWVTGGKPRSEHISPGCPPIADL